MPPLYARLDRVRRLPRSLRDAALRGALPYAAEGEQDAIIAEMLEAASHPKSRFLLDAVVGHWSILSGDAKRAALACLGDGVVPVGKRLAGSQEGADRAGAAAMLRDAIETKMGARVSASRRGEMIRLSASLVDDDVAPVRSAAIAALAVAASAGQTGGASTQKSAPAEDPWLVLDGELAALADRFDDHRHAGLMEVVALVAAHAGPRLRGWLAQRDTTAHSALRSACRDGVGDTPDASLIVSWLAMVSMRLSAVEAIERLGEANALSPIIAASHLLGVRGRREALVRVRGAQHLVPRGDALETIDADVRRGVVRWVQTLPMSGAQRVDALHAQLSDADVGVRARASMALVAQQPSPQTDAALFDFALDCDAGVASLAVGQLVRARGGHRRGSIAEALPTLLRSPHARVRAAVRQASEKNDPWAMPAPEDARWFSYVGARRRVASDRAGFVEALRERLGAARSADEVISLLMMAGRLGLAAEIELELLHFFDGDDKRLTSKSVAMLARIESDAAEACVASAMCHRDARVRATAVEGVAHRSPGLLPTDRLLGDDAPRVRANTIREFFRGRSSRSDASNALAEMIVDPRAAHRVSALWVVERVGQTELAGRVAEMAQRETDVAVRGRAKRCARRLLAEMRVGWSASPWTAPTEPDSGERTPLRRETKWSLASS